MNFSFSDPATLLAVIAGGGISWTLVGLCLRAIVKGQLVPRSTYQDSLNQRDKWETAYWKEKDAGVIQDRQNLELLETARTMKHFIDAFPRAIINEIEETIR